MACRGTALLHLLTLSAQQITIQPPCCLNATVVVPINCVLVSCSPCITNPGNGMNTPIDVSDTVASFYALDLSQVRHT
jgi:hypothetical protein